MIPYVSIGYGQVNVAALSDVISCNVKKTISGEYTLTMTYPYNGKHSDKLIIGNTVYSSTSRVDPEYKERFSINKITQRINGEITIVADQITYNLGKYPVKAFGKERRTPKEAVIAILENCKRDPATDSLFLIADESTEKAEFGVDRPVSAREAMFGTDGIIATYGGYAVANKNVLTWKKTESVGSNKGTIRYGVNLTNYTRSVDASETYSHAYVFWRGFVDIIDENGKKTGTEEKTISVPELVQLGGNDKFNGATILDLSSEFETAPSVDDLINRAQTIAAQRGLRVPTISLDISFIPLRLSEEYKNLKFLEEVDLYDTVSVDVPMYGTTTAVVCETNFDVISENYTRISIGNTRGGIGNLITRLY